MFNTLQPSNSMLSAAVLLAIAVLVLLAAAGCGQTTQRLVKSDVEANLHRAVAYLEDTREASHQTGLLYESPDGTRMIGEVSWQLNQIYWTQTDNFLAALALRPYNPILSDSLQTAIAHYQVPSVAKVNVVAVLGGAVIPESIKAPRTIVEETGDDYIVLTEVQDGADISDWTEYGNLLALQSLNQWIQGNEQGSLRLYLALLDMWDGYGINDKATQADNQYAVYKIALTLLLSKVYEDDRIEMSEMERVMWSAQSLSGGVHTDIDVYTHSVGGFTNTETTSLVLLAYDMELIRSLRSAKL